MKLSRIYPELGREPEKDGPRKLHIGDVVDVGGSHYMLAYINEQGMCAISLLDGNRWRNPIKVRGSVWSGLDARDIKNIFGDNAYKMEFVGNISELYKK